MLRNGWCGIEAEEESREAEVGVRGGQGNDATNVWQAQVQGGHTTVGNYEVFAISIAYGQCILVGLGVQTHVSR